MFPDHRLIIVALVSSVLLVAGCDLPTGPPSIQTNAGLRSPLIAEKTFSFLGGPSSTHDPLIDTTRVDFDSLLSVRGADRTIFVEQSVETFGIQPHHGPLSQWSADMSVDTTMSISALEKGQLGSQGVTASYEQTNGIFESEGRTVSTPVPPTSGTEPTLPFPLNEVIDPPTSDVVDASNATLESVTLTSETVNTITLTLENRQPQGTPLTNGHSGEAPEISIDHQDGTVLLPFTAFGTGPIGPGDARSIEVDVSGTTLSTGAEMQLRIAGNDQNDRLHVDTDPHLRYRAATLSDVDEIQIEARATGLHSPSETPLRVAGVEVDEGAMDVQVKNKLSFPIELDEVTFRNNERALDPLPDTFPALGVSSKDRPSEDLGVGSTTTYSFDLSESGVARRLDAVLRGTPAQSTGTVTLRASGGIQTDGNGDVKVAKMYFWPDGEQIRTAGRFPFRSEKVDFERAEDFVKLASARFQIQDLRSDLGLSFQSVSMSFPGVRRADVNGDGQRYAPADSLVVSLVENPSGPFEFPPLRADDGERDIEVSTDSLRLLPNGNVLDYHAEATLLSVPDTTEEYVRVLNADDQIRADVGLDRFEPHALRARVRPFDLFLTPDADGNGRLDVTDDTETVTKSFQKIQGLVRRMEGLDLSGGTMSFSIASNLNADVRFYGAFRGEGENGTEYLAGRGPHEVSSSDPASGDFEAGGTPVEASNLLKVDAIEGTEGSPATHTVQFTNQNSTIDAFISHLPTTLRLAGKGRVLGGRAHLRSPVDVDLGVGLSVPLSFNGAFSYQDTLSADLTGFEALADSTKRVTVSEATLHLTYSNGMPIGFDVSMSVVDGDGKNAVSIPSDGAPLRLAQAPKTDDGRAASERDGVLSTDLSEQDVRRLAEGSELQLELTMHQQSDGPPAQVRADDTIRLALEAEIDATVRAAF